MSDKATRDDTFDWVLQILQLLRTKSKEPEYLRAMDTAIACIEAAKASTL